MPRADPIVKKGVFNRREKITIDGLTATRAHHQALRRQHMNEKFRNIAKAKRQAAGKSTIPQGLLCSVSTPTNLKPINR